MAPRLRTDLVAATADEQGVMCVEVTDPLTSTNFRFYDFEYALAQQLTGQPLQGVIDWASATFGVDLSVEALDQFIEKLAGLGFLVGGSSGAQPAVLAPFSPSTISQPMEGIPTPDDASAPPISEAPPPSAHPIASGGGLATFGNAMAPEGLISGDATEYRLRDPDSGLWESGQGQQGHSREEPRHTQDKPESPRIVDTEKPVPSRMQVLGGPLPPVAAAGDDAASGVGARPRAHAAPRPVNHEIEAPGQTPLGSIVDAIGTEASGPAPMGALDVGSPGMAASPPGIDPRAPGRSSPAWAKDLVKDVDHPRADRRQPPRPEVVVMPPVAEPPAAAPASRGRSAAFIVVLLLLLGGAGAVFWFFNRPTTTAGPVTSVFAPVPVVRVASPQPTTFYRWFETTGVVIPGRDDTLGFSAGGRLQDAMPPGTTFAAGETIARLQGVAARELIVNRIRSHVAYYEQLRDSSRAEGAEATARQAEAKYAARKQELAAAQAALRQLEIHPKVAGEVAEVLVAKGAFVKPGTPVFRVRAAGPRATFTMAAEDIARARALKFCRVETVPGGAGGGAAGAGGARGDTAPRAIDCTLSSGASGAGGGATRLAVDLTGAGAMAPGTQVRLASARHDAVFPVPRSAVSHEGAEDHVWIVSGGGKSAEGRVVEIAATVDDIALIARGISVGDAVIVDPPNGLKTGAEINVAR